jgi:glycosyltransferase involved in cell wall biosynthesis
MATGNRQKIGNIAFDHPHYVLALPGWYPTWLDPLPGDFNQRHIKAASLYFPQIVLYIAKDQTGTVGRTQVRINEPTTSLLEVLVVYRKSKIRAWDTIQSNILFFVLLMKYSTAIFRKFGKPALLHSYIVMRGGLAGLILSKRWKLPFILSENWTIYYKADPGYLIKRNFVFRWLVKQVFGNLKEFLPVTDDLRRQVSQLVVNVPSTVIPNVVETDIFNFQHDDAFGEPFVFAHVSTMIYQKNPEGLLRVFKKFNDEHRQTFLRLIGPYPQEVSAYAAQIGLTKNEIEFTGAVDYKTVSTLLKQSQSLVLFSRYENLPCVILEAFCCGLPVISTDVGGIREAISAENGVLIENEDEVHLLNAFKKIYTHYKQYNRDEIAKRAYDLFSYRAVGQQINLVYKKLLDEE